MKKMLKIKMEHADGCVWLDEAESTEMAIMYIENEAVDVAESFPSEYYEKIFPMYWKITDENGCELGSGYVDEFGEIRPRKEVWQ